MFDLGSDPREENDLAADHPDVVRQMASRHKSWSGSLAPLGEIPEFRSSEPIIPSGNGWAFVSEENKGVR